jgi:hypothetical protein
MPSLEDDLEAEMLAALEADSSDEEVHSVLIALNYIRSVTNDVSNMRNLRVNVHFFFKSAGDASCPSAFRKCSRKTRPS